VNPEKGIFYSILKDQSEAPSLPEDNRKYSAQVLRQIEATQTVQELSKIYNAFINEINKNRTNYPIGLKDLVVKSYMRKKIDMDW